MIEEGCLLNIRNPKQLPAMIKDNIISFRPNAKTKFIGKTLNAVISINDFSELNSIKCNKKTEINSFRKMFIGSKSRIINYLINQF